MTGNSPVATYMLSAAYVNTDAEIPTPRSWPKRSAAIVRDLESAQREEQERLADRERQEESALFARRWKK